MSAQNIACISRTTTSSTIYRYDGG